MLAGMQDEANMDLRIVPIPVEEGNAHPGCARAPEALEAAGLTAALQARGYRVRTFSPVRANAPPRLRHDNQAIKALPEIVAWARAASQAAFAASAAGLPVFIGGDHSISAGTVAGLARRAALCKRPLFVLWLDAHPDFHTLETTTSGNLHGVPLAYLSGQRGFSGYFPELATTVAPARICPFGLRSVDPAEGAGLKAAGVVAQGMDAIRQRGIAAVLGAFLDGVRRENGLLHVSFDADFLDPTVAPGVGTPVPDGATLVEASEVMDMLGASRLVSSLDLVELNPMLDEDGCTARHLVDLAARLLARQTTGIASARVAA